MEVEYILDSNPGFCRFDSCRPHQFSPCSSAAEHSALNGMRVGSSPTGGTNFCTDQWAEDARSRESGRFDSVSVHLVYGGYRLMVKTSGCDSENESSILSIHPNLFGVNVIGNMVDFDSVDEGSSPSPRTNSQGEIK